MAESQNKEYKQGWRDEYLKWICGFANAQGGTIFIGVNDDGSIANAFYLAGLIEAWGRGYEMIASEFAKEGLQPPTFEELRGGMMATIQRERYVKIMGKETDTTRQNDTVPISDSDTNSVTNSDTNSDNLSISDKQNGVLVTTPDTAPVNERSGKGSGTANQQDSGQVSPSEEKSFVSANDTKQLSERQHLVIRMIQKNDTITINAIAHETKASEITIKRDLAYLQEKGILIREGGRKNGRWVVVNSQKKQTD